MSAPLAFDGTPVPRAVIVVRCAAVWRSVLRRDAGTHTNAIALCPHCVCPQGGKSSTGLGPPRSGGAGDAASSAREGLAAPYGRSRCNCCLCYLCCLELRW